MDRINHPRRIALALLIGLLLVCHAGGVEQLAVDKLNKKIANFTVLDAKGKKLSLYDLKEWKAVVVVFLSFDCPVSKSYSPILAELAKVYEAKGVAFLGMSTDDMDAIKLAKTAAEYRIPFPLFKDDKYVAADAFKAETVPSAFVLDANFVLRYRGRIDNGYAARLRPNRNTTSHDLKDALDDVLAGKDVRTPATKVVGCTLRQRDRETAKTGKVTYYRDVVPILQTHCQECHRPGEVGPFSLMNYAQAANWAPDIRDYTRNRKMPPWKPVESVAMHGERKLTEREIATIAAWVDGGTPEGDPAAAPPPRRFVEGWQLGKPDLVLTVEEDFKLGASGGDLYRNFVLPTGLKEDRYISAIEVRPGNRRIVHHAVLFVDASGQARKVEARSRGKNQRKDDDGPGYSLPMVLSFLPGFLPQRGLGGWAPGQVVRHFPDGTGFHLPAGSDLVVQLHYHRSGRPENDRTSVGLHFAKKPVDHRIQGIVVPGHFLFIPAGAERHPVKGTIWVRQDCHLHAVMPHMHLLGREIKITMVPPGGRPQTLVAIRDWEFNWQETYFLKESIAVKAGTRFDIEGIFDNSARNPNNPARKPRTVFVGLDTTDEMCIGGLFVTTDKPGRIHFDVQPRIQGLNWAPNWGIPLPGI
jgi:peroxiredoxin